MCVRPVSRGGTDTMLRILRFGFYGCRAAVCCMTSEKYRERRTARARNCTLHAIALIFARASRQRIASCSVDLLGFVVLINVPLCSGVIAPSVTLHLSPCKNPVNPMAPWIQACVSLFATTLLQWRRRPNHVRSPETSEQHGTGRIDG